jgi:alkaline phosphatase
MMRNRILIVGSWLALTCAASSAAWGTPLNVILFIGDGMGPEAVNAGRYLLNGNTAPLAFEAFPEQAWMTHHGYGGVTTDSAASATAIATGFKVSNGVISIAQPGNGAALNTVLETFKASGKRTGLVTTGAAITDASPAAFGAHESSRNNQAAIANDYLTQTRPNVLFGGTQADMAANAAGAGYTVTNTTAGLLALDPASNSHFAGLFSGGSQPTLSQMTTKALDILAYNNPNGFFAMIENENTDNGGHANNIGQVANAVIELQDAVQAAVNWSTNAGVLGDTLIIVTADHETGGLTAINNGAGNIPGATWTTTGHSQTPVPVYALGPNSGFVNAYLDNTDLPQIMTTSAIAPATSTVTFQQGDNGYAQAHDTQVRADAPDASFGASALLVVDTDDNAASGSQPSQALVRFDDLFGSGSQQVPAGATITSATLLVSTGSASNDNSPNLASLHPMLVDWSESSTWNDLAGGVSANGTEAVAQADSALAPSTRGVLLAFDVTATVQGWGNGAANHGWAILAGGSDGWRWNSAESTTSALRPMLSITYVVPEPSGFWLTQISLLSLICWRRRRVASLCQVSTRSCME